MVTPEVEEVLQRLEKFTKRNQRAQDGFLVVYPWQITKFIENIRRHNPKKSKQANAQNWDSHFKRVIAKTEGVA